MNDTVRDVVRFFKTHWPHVLLGIPGAIAITAVHELAHCAAVWVQSGTVTEFVFIPSGAQWGHMNFVFPPGAAFNRSAISLAPYMLGIMSCLLVGALALRRKPWPFWAASTFFVWLFIVPVGDIMNGAIPYLLRSAQNDLMRAFGPPTLLWLAIGVAFGIVATAWGYFLNKRLYRDRAMSLPTYSIFAATAALILLVVTT